MKRVLVIFLASILISPIVLQPAAAAYETKPIPFFMPCKTELDMNCIDGINAELPSGKIIKGELTGLFVTDKLSNDDPYLKNISGPKAEWNFPGLTFSNGSGKAVLYAFYWESGSTHCWADGNCSPFEEEFDFYFRPSVSSGSRPPVILTGSDAKIVCPKNPDSCNLGSPPWLFNTEAKFHLLFRMPNGFTPRYTQGRVKNFSIKSAPTTYASIKNDYGNYEAIFSPLKLENVAFTQPDLSVFEKGLYDSDEPAVWVYGASNSKTFSLGNCIGSGGLDVVTNAFYMWNPDWNPTTQSIEVKLQATHFKTDGSPNTGYLEVRIPTKMAKCMWGVSLDGEVSAKVSLTYPDSSIPEILTVTGNINDGDFLMVSTGFHYSSPTVSIKLDNKSNSAVTQVKKTIICLRGKVSKKVSGITPKCPIGYKLK
jgi:hypothetical protein